MVIHYKCSNCGADMAFDSKTGTLHCDSCGRNENIDSLIGANTKDADVNYNMDEKDMKTLQEGFDYDYDDPSNDDIPAEHTTFSPGSTREYHCHNCGAVLITDSQTSATTCSFCNAGVVLKDRLSGTYAPAHVLPFSINKLEAQESFRKWCRKGILFPNNFKAADRITNITGLYVPFWLYDLNGRGEVEATCTIVTTHRRGEWIYTTKKYYLAYRKVDLHYNKLPCDASTKMDDKMMDRLEPFPYNNMKPFQMPYLAGYIAEKYDYTDKDLLPRVKGRVENHVNDYLRSTLSGYTTVSYRHKSINIRQKNAEYALLPVWMVCYDYKDAEHNFIMNGQTGKIVGKPPISRVKVAAWFFGITGVSFLLLRILSMLQEGGII